MKGPYRSLPAVTLAIFVAATLVLTSTAAEVPALPKPDGKPADMTQPVQVFILLGQSNMLGLGKSLSENAVERGCVADQPQPPAQARCLPNKCVLRLVEDDTAALRNFQTGSKVTGGEVSLENAVKNKHKYPYLVDESGKWSERMDVRNVRVMVGRGGGMQLFNNEWMTVAKTKTIGPEFGLGHVVGNAVAAPVMILKSCIGNRSLGWDLLPPGSERFEAGGKVYPGYKERPDSWAADPAKGKATEPPPWLDKSGKPIEWYAGKQYDDDTANAKKVLTELDKYYPGATQYEVAGFFFWQGEKDGGNPVHSAHYEQNLVRFIKHLRKDFNAPNARFVLATLGEATKGSEGNGGLVLNGQLAVDGGSGKYPEFKGNVATVYANPLSLGGSGNSHYGGNAETYMNIGEAMGRAMVELLQATK